MISDRSSWHKSSISYPSLFIKPDTEPQFSLRWSETPLVAFLTIVTKIEAVPFFWDSLYDASGMPDSALFGVAFALAQLVDRDRFRTIENNAVLIFIVIHDHMVAFVEFTREQADRERALDDTSAVRGAAGGRQSSGQSQLLPARRGAAGVSSTFRPCSCRRWRISFICRSTIWLTSVPSSAART